MADEVNPDAKPKRGLPPHLIPGNPGNSGGKPGRSGGPSSEFSAKCRAAFTKHELLNEAVRIALKGKREADRLKAMEFVANYGYGKPNQPVTGDDGQPLLTGLIVHLVRPDDTPPG